MQTQRKRESEREREREKERETHTHTQTHTDKKNSSESIGWASFEAVSIIIHCPVCEHRKPEELRHYGSYYRLSSNCSLHCSFGDSNVIINNASYSKYLHEEDDNHKI